MGESCVFCTPSPQSKGTDRDQHAQTSAGPSRVFTAPCSCPRTECTSCTRCTSHTEVSGWRHLHRLPTVTSCRYYHNKECGVTTDRSAHVPIAHPHLDLWIPRPAVRAEHGRPRRPPGMTSPGPGVPVRSEGVPRGRLNREEFRMTCGKQRGARHGGKSAGNGRGQGQVPGQEQGSRGPSHGSPAHPPSCAPFSVAEAPGVGAACAGGAAGCPTFTSAQS